jgi:putative membrane protein
MDFIPSIFLGCPDTDTELSVLPGHELLKNKRGYEAVYLANKGSFVAIILTTIILIPALLILPKFYSLIENIIPYFLIAVIVFMILNEKRKFSAFIVIILTGLLGLSTNQLEINQPLLPLLTGLFGASNIIISIKNKTYIPEQIITKPKISLKRPILASILSAPICSFLPGVGGGQATIIGNTIIRQSRRQFIILTGIINTLVMSFSIITLYTISKTRTGAASTIQKIIPNLTTNHLILLTVTIIIAGIIAYNLTDKTAKIISTKFEKINYQKLSYITLTILTIITLLISGPKGIFVLIISTFTGIYSINLKVRRTNMMGVLLIPTILWLI